MARKYLTIPECRGQLAVVAHHLRKTGRGTEARQIERIIQHMFRRPSVRTTSVKNRPITPALRHVVRRYARQYPDASQLEIGNAFKLNPGRVSEALAGKRR